MSDVHRQKYRHLLKNAITIRFLNLNGKKFHNMDPTDSTIWCFAEAPFHVCDQFGWTQYRQPTGGMATSLTDPSGKEFRPTGKYTAIYVPIGFTVIEEVDSRYMNSVDEMGRSKYGSRSTNFVRIRSPTGQVFWINCGHFPAGKPDGEAKWPQKKDQILKSILLQAQHIEKTSGDPVFVVCDANITRRGLLDFKQRVESQHVVEGKKPQFEPNEGCYTMIGSKFKLNFGLLPNSEPGIDLTTNINQMSFERFDIDHIIMSVKVVWLEFSIDRSIIGSRGIFGETELFDHAILGLTFVLEPRQ